MPTREEISVKILRDLAERGVTPADPMYEFALESLEAMNAGVADLDDELADIAARLAWLAQTPTWVNRRTPDEFDAFVDSKVAECERSLAAVRARWDTHRQEHPHASAGRPEP